MFASRRSILSPYFRRTSSVLATNQQALSRGCHSAASFAPFSYRFTRGLASVKFRTSRANRAFVTALAAHRLLSWASDGTDKLTEVL